MAAYFRLEAGDTSKDVKEVKSHEKRMRREWLGGNGCFVLFCFGQRGVFNEEESVSK